MSIDSGILPYGFGLNGRLPVWACALLAVPIYLTHVPISMWWLARHRFGPMERAWRFMTYGRIQTVSTEGAPRLPRALRVPE